MHVVTLWPTVLLCPVNSIPVAKTIRPGTVYVYIASSYLNGLLVLLVENDPDLPERGGWIAPLKRVYRCQHSLCHCIPGVSKLPRAQGRESDGGESALTGHRQTASHQPIQNLYGRQRERGDERERDGGVGGGGGRRA